MHKVGAFLHVLAVRFSIWWRLRVLTRTKLSSEQYKGLVSAVLEHPDARDLIWSAQFIGKLAKLSPELRGNATIRIGMSLVTGQLAFELHQDGNSNMPETTLEMTKVLSCAPDEGIIGLGIGEAVRTMEIVALVKAGAVAAALLADDPEGTPARFLAFVASGLADQEQWERVREAFQAARVAAKREEEEGGTVSQEKADELEELFGLSTEGTEA